MLFCIVAYGSRVLNIYLFLVWVNFNVVICSDRTCHFSYAISRKGGDYYLPCVHCNKTRVDFVLTLSSYRLENSAGSICLIFRSHITSFPSFFRWLTCPGNPIRTIQAFNSAAWRLLDQFRFLQAKSVIISSTTFSGMRHCMMHGSPRKLLYC